MSKFALLTLVACILGFAVPIAPALLDNLWTNPLVPSSHHADALKDALQVSGWTTEGLRLGDGRLVQIPGIHRLSTRSIPVQAVIQQGIEVAADHRVYGLVRIWHWCGNDPMKDDTRRVDLGLLIEFYGQPECHSRTPSSGAFPGNFEKADDDFSENGWNVSRYVDFLEFVRGRAI